MSRAADPIAAIARAVNLLNRSLAPVVERGGVTPQQWAVLTVVAAAREPMNLGAVSRELAVTKQNMTGMIERLEQLGLIERLEDPADRRSSRVRLTPRGRKTFTTLSASYERWLRSLGSEGEMRQLARAVNRLIVRLEET